MMQIGISGPEKMPASIRKKINSFMELHLAIQRSTIVKKNRKVTRICFFPNLFAVFVIMRAENPYGTANAGMVSPKNVKLECKSLEISEMTGATR